MTNQLTTRDQWRLYDKISGQFYAIMASKDIDGAYLNGVEYGKIKLPPNHTTGDVVVYGDLTFVFEGSFETTTVKIISIKCCPDFNFRNGPELDISELRARIRVFLYARANWIEAERIKCIEDCLEKYIKS